MMSITLEISTDVPNGFRIPGVISGMRVFLSSKNNIGVTSGRFVSAEGDLIEMPRTVRDVATLLDDSDVVILTATLKCNGICFRLKTLGIVENDEIALAMIKILKSPALETSDISVTHTLSSSNFTCIKSLHFAASADGKTTEFRLPFKISDFHRLEIKIGGYKKKQDTDYEVKNFVNEEGYKYTSIIFKDPPSGSRKVHVSINLNE